jgi:hypothetical protein
MKYMMFVCTDTEPDTDPTDVPDIHAWVAENDGRGRRLQGDALAPTTAATTVRVRGGELLVSDGPFAETTEVIVGFDLLDCADLDEAMRWAERIPVPASGGVEVRPVIDYAAFETAGEDAAAQA